MNGKRILSLALGLQAATAALLTGELYRYVFCREGSPLLTPLLDKKGHAEDYYLHRDGTAAVLRTLPREEFTLLSSRGKMLRGFYYPGGGAGKRIAFLVHGYRSEHAETAGMYRDYYSSRGFDLFCCDHEAHGESEGRFIGFGVYEPEDCLNWIRVLLERFGPDVKIVLHGFSMGAATVMEMAPRCPDNVRFIVEDSGFCDAQSQLRGQLGPLYPPLRALHRLFAGLDLRRADVRPALDRSRVPILFVHGQEDRTVPFENGPLLYEGYGGEKDCLFVPGARHVESMHAAPEAYARKLDAFMEKYL